MEGTPDAGSGDAAAAVCLMENEDFVGGLYLPSERHFTDAEADSRVPGPDSELHLGAGWSWSGPWTRGDWQSTESGRRRQWRRDKSRAEWVILEPAAAGSPPDAAAAASAAAAAAGASPWARLYSTVRSFSSALLQPAPGRAAPVNVRRVRAVVALARLLAADTALLPFAELIEAGRGSPAAVVAAAEALKAHVSALWLAGEAKWSEAEERKSEGELSEEEHERRRRRRERASAVLAALGRVARAAERDGEEYAAAVNAMQPLVFLCGRLPEDDDAARGEHRCFTVTDAMGAPVEMALFEDVLVRGGTEVLPLDWLWIAFQREKGLAKLITLNASWAFVAPPDVLDLLRGAVARWLSRLGAVAAPSLRALRFWCPEFVYRGTARAGQLSGRGTLVLGAGEVLYAGAFEAGRRCGKGMQIDRPSGVTYKGGWLNDRYEGRGVLHWDREHGGDAFKFIGHFRAGLREGPGVLYRSDGSWLSCAWRGDAPLSPAALHSASGTVYSGGWANNAPHGLGVESLPHGRFYGEFAAGQRSGRGVFETFGSPRVCFLGMWAAGSMSGKGSVEIAGVMGLAGMLGGGAAEGGELAVATGRLVLGRAVKESPFPFWHWFVKSQLEALASNFAKEVEALAAEQEAVAGEGLAAIAEEFGVVCGAQLDRRVGPEGLARSRRDYGLFLEALRLAAVARLPPDPPEASLLRLEAALEAAVLRPALFKSLFESCEQPEADATLDAACAAFAKLSPQERAALLGCPALAGEREQEAVAAAASSLRSLGPVATPRGKLAAVAGWLEAAGRGAGENGMDALLPLAIAAMALACVPCLATERRFVEECMGAREREGLRGGGMQGYAWATFVSCLDYCQTLFRRPPPTSHASSPPVHVELEDWDSHLMMNSFHRDVTPTPPPPGSVPRVESADYVLEMEEREK